MQGQLKVAEDELNKVTENKKYVDVLREILNDKGAKAQIIKKYLPIMNQLINQHLQSMDFYVNFNLDEEFNETIKSRFRDTFNYNSFSEGEKMRIDLALLFTWRQIAKMKNSTNTNLLMLDEIFDSSLEEKKYSLKLSNSLKTKTSLLYPTKAIYYLTNLPILLNMKNIRTLQGYNKHDKRGLHITKKTRVD
jgi:hypothetical protein